MFFIFYYNSKINCMQNVSPVIIINRIKEENLNAILPLSLVKTSSMLMTGPEYSSTTSLTASSLYILKQPGQHITDPIMFCELLIIQKSVKENYWNGVKLVK